MSVVISNPPHLAQQVAEGFAPYGVATVDETQGCTGLLASPRASAETMLQQTQARGAEEAQTRARLAHNGLVYRPAEARD